MATGTSLKRPWNACGNLIEPASKLSKKDETPCETWYHQTVLQTVLEMRYIEGCSDPDKEKNPSKRKILQDRKAAKDEQKNTLRKYIGALRNSGGGVIMIKIIDHAEISSYLNKFHKVFDGEFKSFLLHDEKFDNVYKFHILTEGEFFLVFVQGSSKVVTNDTKTKQSFPRGIESMSYEDVFNLFPLKKCKKPVKKSRWRETNYECKYPEEESENVQFKSYRNIKEYEKLKHKLSNDIKLYISAFTKIQQGGSIFFGIEEKDVKGNTIPIVLGLNLQLSATDKLWLQQHCGDIIKEDMMWLSSGGKVLKPKKVEKYFSVNMYPVSGSIEDKYVLEVSVAHFEGIVFHSKKGPIAWRIKDNKICVLEIQEWYNLMNIDFADSEDQQNDANDFLERFQKLSIESSVLDAPKVYQIKDSVTKIRDNIFRMGKPMTLMPTPLVNHLRTKCRGRMAIALDILQKYSRFRKNRCLSIFDENFSIILKEDALLTIPNLCDNCCSLCDVFIVGANSLPFLITICDIPKSHTVCLSKCKNHNYQTAKFLMSMLRIYNKSLFGLMGYTMTLSDDISGQLDEAMELEMRYPESIRMPGNRLANEILLAFVKIVTSIPSPIQNVVGGRFLKTILTEDQYRILYDDFLDKSHLLIHGVPGTGKTELVKEVMKKLSISGNKRDELLFVSEHTPICDVIGKMGICTTLTRYELSDMWSTDPQLFQKIQHCLVDDAQFLKSNWYAILKDVMKDKNRGRFWIFYGNHNYYNGPPVESIIDSKLFTKRKLRNIIRNTKRIAQFAEEYALDHEYSNAVSNIPHDVDGENVSVKYRNTSTEETRNTIFETEVKQCLKRYTAGDIAVLFETIAKIPEKLKREWDYSREKHGDGLDHRSRVIPTLISLPSFGTIKIVNASKNDAKDAIVVDSIRRYASLDRLVVIVIGCTKNDGLRYMAFTRPLAKLIVVWPDAQASV